MRITKLIRNVISLMTISTGPRDPARKAMKQATG